MFVPFDDLPPHARVWVYQADEPFGKEGEDEVNKTLYNFCDQWAVHGQPMRTSFTVAHNRFIILAVDERYYGASGCSIDSSVHALKALETRLNNSLFNRTKVAFFLNGQVKLFAPSELKEAFLHGTLTAESLTFNNLVANKGEWSTNWLTEAKNTWLVRYLPKSAVA